MWASSFASASKTATNTALNMKSGGRKLVGQLANKTALITGGGTGIGRGIALAFANEGCQVIVAGRRLEKLADVASAFSGEPKIQTLQMDVADRDQANQGIAKLLDQYQHIDILVNNAGINVAKRSLREINPEEWDKLFEVNVTGAFNCIRAVMPSMQAKQDGVIINVSSVAGKRASLLGGIGYSASKFAMTALGMTAALELGAEGIRVTNIYPGEVETPILENRPAPVSQERRATMLQPEDLGAAALMVACLPPRAHVAELVIKPTVQEYV